MSDTTHTPGPWAIYGGVQQPGEFIIHKGATDIAVTRWALGDCNANARLIAASPDLLAALQAVAALPGFEPEEPYGMVVLAAIAKATGQ